MAATVQTNATTTAVSGTGPQAPRVKALRRLIDGLTGDVETVTFEGIAFPLTFAFDDTPGEPCPIVIGDADGEELARARSPYHASIIARSLNNAYGPGVKTLPAALMREIRARRPDLVQP